MNSLLESLCELEGVRNYKKLEKLIDSNEKYKQMMDEIFYCQKQMMNSKHFGLDNNYYVFLKKYNELKKQFSNDVLIEMYFNSLEDVNYLLDELTSIITNVINEKLF